MARFDEEANRIELVSDGIPILYSESYEVILGILQQPAAFCLTLGAAVPVRELAELWVPGTPFELRIGGAAQFSGRSDGYTLGKGEGGNRCSVRGRDTLATLNDAFARTEQGFSDASFLDLVNAAMTEAYGLSGAPTVIFSNEANRKAITKAPVEQDSGPVALARVIARGLGFELKLASKAAQSKKLQLKMGQRWLSDFLKPEMDRAGLFLWAAGDGTVMLTTPNTAQQPTFRLFRRNGKTNIIDGEYKNEPTARFSRCEVHSRAGGAADARTKIFASYEDQEMVGWGFDRPLCISDPKSKTIEQAEFLARRKIIEARRGAWSLSYTIAGHALPNLYNGEMSIPAPDVVFEVDDDEFGISGKFWAEAVAHRRNPHRTTTIQLMRVEDVVFGGDPE